MVRRFQLMEPERGLRSRLAHATARLRDGLLRDNKVIPPVLGALALIVFAWIVAGALIDDPREEGDDRQEVANQANRPSQQVAQTPEAGQQGGGGSEAPAPSVENRDAESYAAFEQKDPFRDLFEEPGESGAGAGGDQYGDDGGGGAGGGGNGGGGGSGAGDDQYGGDGSGDGNGSDDGDFMDQTFPGDPGFGDDGGGGSGGGGGGSGSGNGGGSGGGSGGGDDDLFDSGGNLAP